MIRKTIFSLTRRGFGALALGTVLSATLPYSASAEPGARLARSCPSSIVMIWRTATPPDDGGDIEQIVHVR